GKEAKERHIHWDRLWALVAFLALVLPFFHGMSRYFFDSYHEASRPRPYYVFLILDSFAFTFESVLFFVLSRSLPKVQWRRFYFPVTLLLLVDIFWATISAFCHAPEMWKWVEVNAVFTPLLLEVLAGFRAPDSWWGMRLATVLIVLRMFADFAVSFPFYFPP